jgi:RND family efflux transporter MFP subunit
MTTFKNYRHCFTAIAIAAATVGCNRIAPTPEPEAEKSTAPNAKVEVAEAQPITLESFIVVPTSVEGYEQSPVMPKIDGYIRTVAVNIGDEVKAGQTLIEIEVPELNFATQAAEQLVNRAKADALVRAAELRAAQAKLKEQQALVELRGSEHARIARLVSGGSLKRQKLEEAQFALLSAKSSLASVTDQLEVARARVDMSAKEIAVAQAQHEQAKAMAGYQRITAPFDGVITKRSIDPGTYVQHANRGGSTKPMLIIAQNQKVRAVVHLTMKQAGQLDLNDPAVLTVEDQPGKSFHGKVSRYAKSYDVGTRMMRAEVDLDNPINADTGRRLLRPGTYGSLKITVASKTGPAVPKTAIKEFRGAKFVTVVGPDGLCHEVQVETSIENDRFISISAGLKPHERVVADQKTPVQNGQRLSAESMRRWF